MKTRGLVTAALIAGGLAFGGMTGTAAAASAPAAVASATPSWHLSGYYKLRSECVRVGFTAITNGGIVTDFKCVLTGSQFALYLYY